jgi:F-type H+-transporting ATPase subunit alpha
VREILKQDQSSALSAGEQIGVLFAVTAGMLDGIVLDRIPEAERLIRERLGIEIPNLDATLGGAGPKAPIWEKISSLIAEAVAPLRGEREDPGRTR